jgi:hypothetical protein
LRKVAAARSRLGRAGLAAWRFAAAARALERTLLNAKSIGFNGRGATRAGAEAMFAKLGIAEDLKPKIKLLKVSAPHAVADGEVELALSPASEVILRRAARRHRAGRLSGAHRARRRRVVRQPEPGGRQGPDQVSHGAGRTAGAEAEGDGARVSRRPFPLTPRRLAPSGTVPRSTLVHWTPARPPTVHDFLAKSAIIS